MVWLKRLFGARPAPGTEIVPGRLRVHITAHDFAVDRRTLPCWTYVTDGFAAVGQKEFVFTLLRGRGDDPDEAPGDPLLFFKQLYSLARKKQFVDAGEFACFHPPTDTFLGLYGVVGFAFVPPRDLPDVDTPPVDRCLTAIFLVPGEAEAVEDGFAYRVLARLGRANTYFPHPPWCDPRRSPVLTREEFGASILGRMPVAHLGGAFARMILRPPEAGPATTGDPLTLRVRQDRLQEVRELLGEVATGTEGAFAFTLEADPTANARLAWVPGDTELCTVTTGDGLCLTGGFVSMTFGPKVRNGGHVVEDGFALTFGPETWPRVRDALLTGKTLALPAAPPGEVSLTVEWIR